MKLRPKLPSFLIITTLVILIGCSRSSIKSYPSLANMGVLPLSTSNAYVAGNLFIAREAELSPFLYNFLKSKGGPTAIEIIEDQFSPARVLMFYPKDKEVYAADIQETKTSRQWIIRGPYTIDRKDFRNLAALETSMHGEPVFVIRGRQQRFRFEAEPPKRRIIEPVIAPLPTPKPTSKPRSHKIRKSEDDSVVIAKKGDSPTEFRPLNSDQQAIQMSLGFAERASNGDVIHTTKAGETIVAISKWYTGSEVNIEAIAEASHLKVDGLLTPGIRVRVPLKSLKTTKAMP